MGKTQCKRTCESEKQLLHATHNGKVEKKECGRCPLLTRATHILENQVEKMTWKAFLLSEQNRQKDEYINYLEERLQDSEKRATDVIVVTMSSHHEEGETICTRESVVCQREQPTDPVGPVEEEVNVDVTAQTLPLNTGVEKGKIACYHVMTTPCDQYDALEVERIHREKMEMFGICVWCLRYYPLSKYSNHTSICRVRRLMAYPCSVCGGVKMTNRRGKKFHVLCNLCEHVIFKSNWDNHASKCGKKFFQFHCTCKTVLQ